MFSILILLLFFLNVSQQTWPAGLRGFENCADEPITRDGPTLTNCIENNNKVLEGEDSIKYYRLGPNGFDSL